MASLCWCGKWVQACDVLVFSMSSPNNIPSVQELSFTTGHVNYNEINQMVCFHSFSLIYGCILIKHKSDLIWTHR